MGQNGRLVAEYAGSGKLSERISLIISGMIFGDMLDIAKWLRMRRKYPRRDLLPMTSLPHRHLIAGNAAVVESCLTAGPYTTIYDSYDGYCKSVTIRMRVPCSDVLVSEAAIGHPDMWSACNRHVP